MQQSATIYNGDRGQAFVDLIKGFLKKGGIESKYIEKITTPDCMQLFSHIFTDKSADPVNNYEFMEELGDAVANVSSVLYMNERFPEIRCPSGVQVIGRLKINYVSKESFFPVAKELGFWPFITANIETRQRSMKPLLEDVFEAVYGLTTLLLNQKIKKNVGFAIVPNIIANLYNKVDISLNYYDLYDPKTILKQLFDKHKDLGKEQYTPPRTIKDNPNDEYSYTYIKVLQVLPDGRRIQIGEGTGSLKKVAEQNAAKSALQTLASQGIHPEIPEGFQTYGQLTCTDTLPTVDEVDIHRGDRSEQFTEFLRMFLKKGKLKDDIIDMIVSSDTMDMWDTVFTDKSSGSKNNWYIRFIGHTTVNALLVWYFNQRFPQIHCAKGVPVLARLKIVYPSKRTFFHIAKKLGMLPFVTSSIGKRENKSVNDLLTHCLEAVFGAITMLLDEKIKKNIGLCIVFDIIKNIYDEMVDISLNYCNLFDSKTILKQLFDKRKDLGTTNYKYEIKKDDPDDNFSYSFIQIFLVSPSGTRLIGEGSGDSKADAEQIASRLALEYLARLGIKPNIPKDYLMFCD